MSASAENPTARIRFAGTRWDIVQSIVSAAPDGTLPGCALCKCDTRLRSFVWWNKTEDTLLCEACYQETQSKILYVRALLTS